MNPYVGEIRIFGFNFAPVGWAICNGQILAISQNTALFSILGTQFGGNGTSNFALPNLQGCVPLSIGQGPGTSNYNVGETGGTETVTLTVAQMPSHTHAVQAVATPANLKAPVANSSALARSTQGAAYIAKQGLTSLNPAMIGAAGGGQPHNNLMPYLTINFCIAMQGVFPPRN